MEMKPWAEENFLERLMPQLRQETRARIEACPDSELLTAFTEDRVTSFVREAVMAHVAQCRECSEICARLVNFARVTTPAQDAEWGNADKRLGNWMDGFLAGRAVASAKAAPEPVSGLRSKLAAREVPKAASWWRMSWAVGAAAVVALVVVGFVIARRGGWMGGTAGQVAVRQTPPLVTNPAPAPAQVTQTPVLEAAKVVDPPAIGQTIPKPDARTQRDGTNGAGTKKSSAPSVRQKSTVPAGGAQPEPVSPTPAPSNVPSHDANQVAGFTPPVLSPNDRILTGGGANASAPTRPASVDRAASSPRHSSQSAGGTTGANLAPSNPVPSYVAPSTDQVRAMPANLRLTAGTRLWIRVALNTPQSDGSFIFRGSLFQPVSAAGNIPLDRGTEVSGSGNVKDGKVTIFVRSFAIRGVSYALKGAAGKPGELTPGAGKAVQFENGEVLEMWLSSATVYEKSEGTRD